MNKLKITILSLVACMLSIGVFAQKSKIRTAAQYLEDKDYTKALSTIGEALAHEDTKDNADAWFTQAAIYIQMAVEKQMDETKAINNAYESLNKVMTLKPNYDAAKITAPLAGVGYSLYNQASQAFNSKNYSSSFDYFEKAKNLLGSSYFKGQKSIDTLLVTASKFQAIGALYDNKAEKAIPIFESLKDNPIAKDEQLYGSLIQAYEATNNESKLTQTVADARKLFPSNKQFVNAELNYYIKQGKQDVLIKKLEEAIASDPGNDELWFNTAVCYDNLANPKDNSGKELPRPANAAEYVVKASAAYDKALELKPNEPGYLYNRGTLFFNEGVQFNRQMNEISDMSATGQKKYDALKAKRDEQFSKSLPYFEKIASSQDGKWSSLSAEDKNSYRQALNALSQIYGLQGQTQKMNDVKNKLQSLQ